MKVSSTIITTYIYNIYIYIATTVHSGGFRGGKGGANVVSFPDRIFRARPPEKRVWWTAYSVFVQVRRNAGALFFSNLTLDVIEDCIPHCVLAIC